MVWYLYLVDDATGEEGWADLSVFVEVQGDESIDAQRRVVVHD